MITESDPILRYEYKNGVQRVFPEHPFVKNWIFESDQKDEATLAHSLAIVAEKNGLTSNDMMHLFPGILRMLKSKSKWAE